MSQDFAKALVEDYAAWGLGRVINATTLGNEQGDTVEFAVAYGDDAETLEVYHNGDLIRAISYDDADFTKHLVHLVTNLLEPTEIHS